STADVLASVGGAAGSVSSVPAPDSPAPPPVTSPTTVGERPQIVPICEQILAVANRMDRMAASLDSLAGGAGESPSVHHVREVTVGSGDLDESLVPGEATEAGTSGAHKERVVREEGGGLEVTRSSPMLEQVQRPRMDGNERPSDLVERTATPSAARVGSTTGSTADVLASAGSVGAAAGGAGSVSRVPAPDSPAPPPVTSPTTEGERPQIVPICEQILAVANRMDRMRAFLDSLAGDAEEAPSMQSGREVTIGSAVLDESLAPQDVTETLASPTDEAEGPPLSERILAMANRVSQIHIVPASAAGDAGEMSSARSVREVTVGSGGLAVSLAPGEATEAVTRAAPKDMEVSDGEGSPATHGAASGETPVVEATMAPGGLVLEVDRGELGAIEGVSDETAGASTALVPGDGVGAARSPVSSAKTMDRTESPMAAAEKAEEGGIDPVVESGIAAVETAVAPGALTTIKTRKV
ncbi:unnamed protein product, partial [Ectocarpus fasciculatus]